MRYEGVDGRVAIVTGANHGIGAATARALAASGAPVLLTYLRVREPADPSLTEAYRAARAGDAGDVIETIRQAGGQAERLIMPAVTVDNPLVLPRLERPDLSATDPRPVASVVAAHHAVEGAGFEVWRPFPGGMSLAARRGDASSD